MSARDAKYVNGDIPQRKRRVAHVKRELYAYWEELATHTGKWVVDATESAEWQAKAKKRATYYELVTECVAAFWGPGFFFALPMGLGEAERRVKEVVMPKLKEARGLGVERVWFLHGKKLIEIDDFVRKWCGAQAADKEARAQVSCALYELCEYRPRDAPGLAGLEALKKAWFGVYEAVWMVSESAAQWQLEVLLRRVWVLPVAREAFEVAGAAGTAGAGRRAARAEVDKLLDKVAENLDTLVNVLEQARRSTQSATHGADPEALVPEARLTDLLQQLRECR
jgi:hypothetical protein